MPGAATMKAQLSRLETVRQCLMIGDLIETHIAAIGAFFMPDVKAGMACFTACSTSAQTKTPAKAIRTAPLA